MEKLILTIICFQSCFGILATGTIVEKTLEDILHTNTNKPVNIIIKHAEGTGNILNQINEKRFSDRNEKLAALGAALEEHANSAQAPILNLLNQFANTSPSLEISSFWISNEISVRGVQPNQVSTLLSILGNSIGRIGLEKTYQISNPIINVDETSRASVTWGNEQINTQGAWSLCANCHGKGVVVGQIDTGVRATHEAVKGSFRGSYGWYV